MENFKANTVYNKPNIFENIVTCENEYLFEYFRADDVYFRHKAPVWVVANYMWNLSDLWDLSEYGQCRTGGSFNLEEDKLQLTYAEPEGKFDIVSLQDEYDSLIRYFVKRVLNYNDSWVYTYTYDCDNLPMPPNLILNGVGSPAYCYKQNYWLKIYIGYNNINKHINKKNSSFKEYDVNKDPLDETGIKLIIDALKLRPTEISIGID